MGKLIDRVLIVHPFGIGDTLFMTPVIRALHEHGAKRIDLLLGGRTEALFRHHPFVSNRYVIDKSCFHTQTWIQNGRELFSLFLQLRKNHYTHLIDLSFSSEYAFYAFLCGIPERIGFDYKGRGFFLNQRIALKDGYSEKHVVEYYFDLLRRLGVNVRSNFLELFLSPEDGKEAAQHLHAEGVGSADSFIAVAPGGGESWGCDARLKRWPVFYFADLIKKIQAEKAAGPVSHILILGSKNETGLGESLKAFLDNGAVNLCGQTSLLATAAIIKRSRFLLANDGGLVHMAQAVKTPVVAIFGPVDTKVYGPYPAGSRSVAVVHEQLECRPCYRRMRYHGSCEGVECLKRLDPEYVFQKLKTEDFFKSVCSHVAVS